MGSARPGAGAGARSGVGAGAGAGARRAGSGAVSGAKRAGSGAVSGAKRAGAGAAAGGLGRGTAVGGRNTKVGAGGSVTNVRFGEGASSGSARRSGAGHSPSRKAQATGGAGTAGAKRAARAGAKPARRSVKAQVARAEQRPKVAVKRRNNNVGNSVSAGAAGGTVRKTGGSTISNLATLQTGDVTLTRRQLVLGAGAVAALAIAGTTTYSCVTNSEGSSSSSTLTVPESAVISEQDLTEISEENAPFEVAKSVTLPYGTMVWTNNSQNAVCVVPTETGSPLTEVRLLSLESGNVSTLLSVAAGADDGFEIFDARATESGVVWVEANILEGTWRVYQATLSALEGVAGSAGSGSGSSSGESSSSSSSSTSSSTNSATASAIAAAATLCAQGDDNWEMPTLAAVGNWAFWQLLPSSSGSATSEPSTLCRIKFGNAAGTDEVVYSSNGKMACAPTACAAGVAIAPRAPESTQRYQLTYIDADTAAVTDKLTLPSSMKPNYLSYGPTGFSFSFEGIYDFGDGISNMGTYVPTQGVSLDYASAAVDASTSTAQSKHDGNTSELTDTETKTAQARATDAVCDLYSAANWFRYTRTPLTTPAWCGNYMIVKSTRNVVAVDVNAKTFYAFTVDNGAPSYGEFLSSSGKTDKFVTFTNVDYTPVNGSETKQCVVKIYTAK